MALIRARGLPGAAHVPAQDLPGLRRRFWSRAPGVSSRWQKLAHVETLGGLGLGDGMGRHICRPSLVLIMSGAELGKPQIAHLGQCKANRPRRSGGGKLTAGLQRVERLSAPSAPRRSPGMRIRLSGGLRGENMYFSSSSAAGGWG
jgi:hypothetical protein